MGSADGALKAAARRTGLSVTEYQDRLNAGLLWCWRDQAWEPAENFGVDRSRPTGRDTSCRRSKNAAARARHQSKERERGRRLVEARDGDKLQARRRVNYLVELGEIPPPQALACTDCGHLGPDRRHEYDHHQGYTPDHHEHVEPVCAPCHHAREADRAH